MWTVTPILKDIKRSFTEFLWEPSVVTCKLLHWTLVNLCSSSVKLSVNVKIWSESQPWEELCWDFNTRNENHRVKPGDQTKSKKNRTKSKENSLKTYLQDMYLVISERARLYCYGPRPSEISYLFSPYNENDGILCIFKCCPCFMIWVAGIIEEGRLLYLDLLFTISFGQNCVFHRRTRNQNNVISNTE